MKDELFNPTGVGSIAWYLQTFKSNPDRKGFTYLRKEAKGLGQFEDVKTRVEFLVGARYLDKHSKPDQPKGDRYTVTSFGHRYLDQHQDVIDTAANMIADKDRALYRTQDLVDAVPDPAVERDDEETPPTVSGPVESEAIIAARKRIAIKERAIVADGQKKLDEVKERMENASPSALIGRQFETKDHPPFVPKFGEPKHDPGYSFQKGKKRLPGGEPIESMDNDEISIEEDAPADAPGFISEEDDDIAEAPTKGEERNFDDSDDLDVTADVKTETVGYLKEVAGRILYDRHAEEVTVVDLINEIEKEEN